VPKFIPATKGMLTVSFQHHWLHDGPHSKHTQYSGTLAP